MNREVELFADGGDEEGVKFCVGGGGLEILANGLVDWRVEGDDDKMAELVDMLVGIVD